MHEKVLVQDLQRKLLEVAAREKATRILRVRVWVGALSHVTEDSLRGLWPDLVKGGPAAGSELEIEMSGDPHHPQAQSLILSSVVLPGSEVPP